MIFDLVLRVIVICIAFMVSITVTLIMLVFTLRGPVAEIGRSAGQSYSGIDDMDTAIDAIFTILEVFAKLVGGVTLSAMLLPAIAVIIIGEAMRLRSWIYYVLGGGVALGMGAAVQGLDFELIDFALPGFALSLVSSGFVGGAAYWLLAGRRAGIRLS